MILIHKGEPPQTHVEGGTAATEGLCTLYSADSEAYASGIKRFAFRHEIYASLAVKAALASSHHGKCCYCETLIAKPAYAHVEHWRPKAYARQTRHSRPIRPGYYWLTYEWGNLLWSCGPCNCEHKGNVFPVQDPSRRALNHAMPLEAERPMILNPAGSLDPREHIAFHQEVPYGLTDLGRWTIEVLGLDELREERLRHLSELRTRVLMVEKLGVVDHPVAQAYAQEAREFLVAAVRPEMPFSAMASDFLRPAP